MTTANRLSALEIIAHKLATIQHFRPLASGDCEPAFKYCALCGSKWETVMNPEEWHEDGCEIGELVGK